MYKRCFRILILPILSFFLLIFSVWQPALAQSPDGKWSDFVDISNSPVSSSYPTLAVDKSGRVHVLWSEDVGGESGNLVLNPQGTPVLDTMGNPIYLSQKSGNTLFYALWDGKQWHKPQDLFYNSQGILEYPDAVVDPNGILHVIWIANQGGITQLLYSQVFSDEAENPLSWSTPVVLAESVLAAYYPSAIGADSTGGLHVVYSALGTSPGLDVINSYDGGITWSDPSKLFLTFDNTGSEEGVSTIRLVVDKKDRIHVTFSRFGKDGNGKAIYYLQSDDYGKTWTAPFEVSSWQPGFYEVDWLSAGVVNNEIHLVWEGGPLAFVNERISKDGGVTWDEPHQIMPNLVGENGFADLVVDSADQLYALVVKRADPSSRTNGIWFSQWNKDQWSYPLLLGSYKYSLYSTAKTIPEPELQNILRGTFTGNGIRYQRAAIVSGNQLFVVAVNEYGGDIYASQTELSAPKIDPRLYSKPSAPLVVVTNVPTLQVPEIKPTPILNPLNQPLANPGQQDFNGIMFGIFSAFVLVVSVGVFLKKIRR
jgi:hypothetical protein